MNIINSQFPSIEQVTDTYLNSGSKAGITPLSNNTQSFADVLKVKQGERFSLERITQQKELKFSKHATNRLNDRNIELSEGQMDRLNEGIEKASKKGINESLVLIDELAFIVNTKNNTVITAMDQTASDENVFTNIDGAVIA